MGAVGKEFAMMASNDRDISIVERVVDCYVWPTIQIRSKK